MEPVTEGPSPPRLSSLKRFFERQLALGQAAPFCLAGGTSLFEAGEESDHLYFLRTGRLAARVGGANPRLVLVHPGELVGEMAVLAGVPHSTHVFALRDCEVLALEREAFFTAVQLDPELLVDLARLVLTRVRETGANQESTARRVFGFFAVSPGVHVRPLVDGIGAALRRLGYRTATLGAEEGPARAEWFANIESRNDFVLYAAEFADLAWRALVKRQVDAVFRVGDGAERPGPEAFASAPDLGDDLILLQPPERSAPTGSASWVSVHKPARLFQMRRGMAADIERMARVMSGRAVALVLSGGAARAYAHVGAIQAMREIGAPIDFLGGVSMGAIIGAGIAMGWDDEELDRRIRQAFVASSPVDDLTLPLVAFARGGKVRERLAHHFGDRATEDLWLPFFCISTNLTTGAQQVHRQGRVRDVLLASLSLPGILPPVTSGDEVLVDGAVLNNYPADIMRAFHTGPIVGVDVGRGRSIEAADVAGPTSVMRWLLSGAWRSGAPIVSVLMRAATVTAYHQITAAHQVTDVLIEPEVDNIEIRDWKAYDSAVSEGRRAALAAFAALETPVTDIRPVSAACEEPL